VTARPPSLAIVGVGLIGASMALALRDAFATITGVDVDADRLAYALERGMIDVVTDDPLRALASDVVVVAAPVDASLRILDALSAASNGHMPGLVIDVASVQEPFLRFGAALPTFVTTHPIAGSERGGPAAADAALFRDRTWLHEPHPDRAVVERLDGVIRACGARPYPIAAARHDELIAALSHLPQAVSVALGATVGTAFHDTLAADARAIAGPGLASMLRLAASPPEVWGPIFTANAAHLAPVLRVLAERLKQAADGLEAGNPAPLLSYFVESQPAVSATERFSRPQR
jgi:prephenate dehydrogenase